MSKADDCTIPIRSPLGGNVVKFPGNFRKVRARKPATSKNVEEASREFVRSVIHEEMAPAEEGAQPSRSLSTTAENGRLRKERNDAWRAAEAATDYWEAKVRFFRRTLRAQRHGIPDALSYPAAKLSDDPPLQKKYDEALVKQLLTPAPTVLAVNWKKAILTKGRRLKYLGVKPERLQRIIDEDMAWLAAHPVRRSNSEAMARKREFNEGAGRIFERNPIIGPRFVMAPDEFIAAMSTLPIADQEAITAVARGMLTLQKKRDQ